MGRETVASLTAKLVLGCITFSLIKFMSQTCVNIPDDQYTSPGKCPIGEVRFERPMFIAFVMVASMALALPYYYVFRQRQTGNSRIVYLYSLLPAVLDAVSIVLMMAGAIFIPMSLTLTLKGARIMYTAVLVVVVFKRKQTSFNWFSIFLSVIGVGLASLSSMLNSPDIQSSALIGIGLTLVSELLRALMTVSEEWLMKCRGADPVLLIGLQGLYGGGILSICVVLAWAAIPGADFGSYESLETTVSMVTHSPLLITLLSILPVIIALFYISSVLVTKFLSSVHNAIVSVLMTALVWLIEIFIHYVVNVNFGAPFGPYSPLQLVGFGFVVASSLVYDGTIIQLPWMFTYQPRMEKCNSKTSLTDDLTVSTAPPN
jgi:hypothetical protein